MTSLRPGGPETVVAAAVATLGVLLALDGAAYRSTGGVAAEIVVALATAGIVAISRRHPGPALGLVWVVAIGHVLSGVPVGFVEVAFTVVAFTTARWGSTLVMTLSGLSIAAVGFLGVLTVVAYRFADVNLLPVGLDYALGAWQYRFGGLAYLAVPLAGAVLLGVPWLAGLVLRFSDRASLSQAGQEQAEEVASRARLESEQAQRETEQAHEIARLRDDQARLARDVHDVVGHSLAVILAQAESAQFVPDVDTEKLKATMATIATSARSSLQDVRHVLTAAAGDTTSAVAPRGLDTLVEGVRASGHEVVSRELGTPQPLPPDLEVVAYRVLQEMLTNAIKHGSREQPVHVERLWPDGAWAGELRLEVRNSIAATGEPVIQQTVTDETQPLSALPSAPPPPPPPPGVPSPAEDARGLDGMRRRLEACGGRLDVRRRDGEHPGEPATFTTTAWVPVRTVSP